MIRRALWPVVLLLFLVACDSAGPRIDLGSSRSTPISDLPIRSTIVEAAIPTSVPASIIAEADAEFLLLSNIYERTVPSVVNIEADTPTGNGATASLALSRGSGFFVDTQGHIVTNAHVIRGALDIRVTFEDGYVAEARTVGSDLYSDLAVLKVHVDAERSRPLPIIENSDTVRVGQRAISIGNPFGLNSSMSVGIISGVGRTLRSAELIDTNAPVGFQNPSIIQTDTPINPGNSGGPLLDSTGQVVGVTTAIRTESGVFQGVGFAVPANTVRRVVPELIQKGRVDYSWIGITVTAEENGYGVAGLAEPLALPVRSGVLLRGVAENSPADEAGLRGGSSVRQIRGQPVCVGGDIIVALNGYYVANMDELLTYLVTDTRPGDTIQVRIVRGLETFDVPMTLRTRPAREGVLRDCAG